MDVLAQPCTAFSGTAKMKAGPLVEVALTVKAALEQNAQLQILVFNDADGKVIDLDLRGGQVELIQSLLSMPLGSKALQQSKLNTTDVVAAQVVAADTTQATSIEPAKRGRPKLGVVGKEVTLLPRHWDWLAEQSGGASVALRKLIDQARKAEPDHGQARKQQERCYRFMSAMAGNLSHFEEVSRCLFAMDIQGFKQHMQQWPQDVQDYSLQLLQAP